MKFTKQELRGHFRELRGKITDEQQSQWSRAIHEQLDRDPRLAAARTVFSYISCGREVETRSYLRGLLRRGVRVFTPASDRRLPPLPRLYEVSLNSNGELTEPVELPGAAVEEIDAYLVPGIVWDHHGFRIGFGGGYFDRLLAAASPGAATLGLAFHLQLVEQVPMDPWDIPVQRVITEFGGFKAGGK